MQNNTQQKQITEERVMKVQIKHIYVVEVRINGCYKISQEAYDSYDKAVAFIKGRSDNPAKVTIYHYKSDHFDYLIHDLVLV